MNVRAANAREPVHARLVYATEDPRATCASEADFRGMVAARLGYDPFENASSSTLVFRVRLDARAKRPRAEIVSERDGAPAGKRVLDDATCPALSETVAATLAIAIDPLAMSSPATTPPPPDPTPPPPPEPATPPPPVDAKPPEDPKPRPPIVPFVFLDGTVAVGRTDGVPLGGRAGGGLGYGALSIAIEARGEATPGSVRLTPIDRVSWSVFSGGLSVCGRKSVVEACVMGALGSLQAKAEDVNRPSLKGTLFGVVGPRAGVVFPLTTDIGVRANAELGIPLVRTTFNIDGKPAWTAPAVQGSFAVGLEVRFP